MRRCEGEGMTTVSEFTVREGETLSFTLTYCFVAGEGRRECDCAEDGA